MTGLQQRLAETIVAHRTGGLCPVAGPCTHCDCFDPRHELEQRDAAELAPVVQGWIDESTKAAYDRVAAMAEGAVLDMLEPHTEGFRSGWSSACEAIGKRAREMGQGE